MAQSQPELFLATFTPTHAFDASDNTFPLHQSEFISKNAAHVERNIDIIAGSRN